jgi:hypothetical protein
VSVLHASAPHRGDQHTQLRVPVVLPLVQVTIDEHGRLDVVVDREPYDLDGPLTTRTDLHRVLDRITGEIGSPVRVEVREPDDSVFTDIITPKPQRDGRSQQVARSSIVWSPGEVAGDGFLPHEQIAVAVVVAHQVASQDGTARLRLPPTLLANRPGIVVLLGRTSGAVAVSGGTA